MEKFFSFVEVKGENDCWLWSGKTCANGRYGRVLGRGKFTMAHRLSYQLFKGDIPLGMVVMHSCDNGLCVNPSHLSIGTIQDNSIDMVNKNRHNSIFKPGTQGGENNAHAKLNRAIVNEIRKFHQETKCSYEKLRAEFGLCSKGHARNIAIGLSWK